MTLFLLFWTNRKKMRFWSFSERDEGSARDNLAMTARCTRAAWTGVDAIHTKGLAHRVHGELVGLWATQETRRSA